METRQPGCTDGGESTTSPAARPPARRGGLLVAALLALAPVACQGDRAAPSLSIGGTRGGAPGSEAGVVEPGAGCGVPGAGPLEEVGNFVDAVAMGRCGHLAFVSSGPTGQTLRVLAPGGELLGSFEEQAGWFGGLWFSADGQRLAFETLRSDLGFGDWTVVDLAEPTVPAAVVTFETTGPMGFFDGAAGAGSWHCDGGPLGQGPGRLIRSDAFGQADVATGVRCDRAVFREAVVVAPTSEGLRWWDLAAGTEGALADAGATFGDVQDADRACCAAPFVVSSDGRYVALAPPGAGAGPVRLSVLDRVTAEPVASFDGDIQLAVLAPGSSTMLFPDGADTRFVLADGTAGVRTGALPAAALSDGVRAILYPTAGDGSIGLVLMDLVTGGSTVLAESGVQSVRLSTGERAAAFVTADGAGWTLHLWRTGAGAVELVEAQTAITAHWVGDEGQVLAAVDPAAAGPGGVDPLAGRYAGKAAPALILPDAPGDDAGGTVQWIVGAQGVDRVTPAGAVLLVAVKAANDELYAVDIASGRSTLVREGHAFDLWTDEAANVLAARYGPLSGTSDSLLYGAVPAP